MTDSSNTSTERSSSSAPTSTTETHSPSDDPVTGESSSDIEPTNVPPTPGTLDKVADLTVLDKDEKEVSFKSLYWPQNEEERVQGRKVMIIFIRHFFCGVSRQSYFSTTMTDLCAELPGIYTASQ